MRNYLRLWYWRWTLKHAQEFQRGLERTIVNERARAVRLIQYAEIKARRAEIAIVKARADAQLSQRIMESTNEPNL